MGWRYVKFFKSVILVKIPKKTIIIIALLRMNLASDHLNKDRILILRSKAIKKRCSLGILRENLQLTGNGNHRQKCKKYSLFSLINYVLLTVLFKKISIFTSKNKIKSFIWQLRKCLNSNQKNNARIVLSDPKNIKKSLVPKDSTKLIFSKWSMPPSWIYGSIKKL